MLNVKWGFDLGRLPCLYSLNLRNKASGLAVNNRRLSLEGCFDPLVPQFVLPCWPTKQKRQYGLTES